MKEWKFAMIALGIVIVFLLYSANDKPTYKQTEIESKLPEKLQKNRSENPTIRVLIKNNGFRNLHHSKVKISAKGGLLVKNDGMVKEYAEEQNFEVELGDEMLSDGSIVIEPKVKEEQLIIWNLERGVKKPSYRGFLELYAEKEGIVVVNQLLLEEYLCAVVPSEMPASWEMEALKAQAVCARSYAYSQMQRLAYPEYQAHVDDSVSYQVYNNSEEQKRSTKAVWETAGQMLWYGEQVAKTYFYSTSGGFSTSIEAWGTKLNEQNQYLSGVEIKDAAGKFLEKEQGWYRWQAKIPKEVVERNVDVGEVQDIQILKRGEGDVALQIIIMGTEGEHTVETEYAIRKVLGGEGYSIEKQDGTVVKSSALLPSAFIEVETQDTCFIIRGKGYGHGIGMSQSGANELAKAGKTYEEILTFFYPGTKVESNESV